MKKLTLASLVSLAGLASSSGAVILFQNEYIPIPNNFTGVYLDIETGTSFTTSGGDASADVNFFFGGEGVSNDYHSAATAPRLQFLGSDDDSTPNSNFESIVNLAADCTETVGPTPTTGTFTTGFGGSGYTDEHIGTGAGEFEDGVRGHLGFSLQISGQTHYGYFAVTLTDNGVGGTIDGWAYESTPNTAIKVAPIPEPSTGLLGLMSLGLLCIRRR